MNTLSPIVFTVLILMQALFLCLILCFTLKTSWFSYILFLIFLGGLIIIFSYVCRLASNENVYRELSNNFLIIALIVITLIILFSEQENIQIVNSNVERIFKILNKFLLTPSVLSIFYLLITLIVIVKISFKKIGSLRSRKKYDNSKKKPFI